MESDGYATSNRPAKSVSDFTAASGSLTFRASETSKTVRVPTTEDSLNEKDETFTLTLSNPTSAKLDDAVATVTINDDDDEASPPAPQSLRTDPDDLQVTLAWTAPEYDGVITRYEVRHAAVPPVQPSVPDDYP